MSEIFVGVDGCKGVSNCRTSWFAIALTDGGDYKAECFDSISALWNRYKNASKILIDIPIGLRDKGDKKREEKRKCDMEARAKLKRRRASSVFAAPSRPAIREDDYNKAKTRNRAVTTKGLTKQTFNIMPKIRDVDNFLRKNKSARSLIRETHPEICFWGLNGGQAISDKKSTPKGQEQRIKKLKAFCPQTNRIIEYVKSKYKRKEVAIDDILDALVAAITAKLGYPERFEKLPKELETDSEGLPMQILYYLHNKADYR